MRATLLLSILMVAAPVAASAQDATDRRRQQAYDNLRDLEQTQRLNEAERQLSNIELRQRTEQSQRLLSAPVRVRPENPYANALPTAATTLTAEDLARDAELAASNARLKEIAERQRLRR